MRAWNRGMPWCGSSMGSGRCSVSLHDALPILESLRITSGAQRLELDRKEDGFILRAPEKGEVDAEADNERLDAILGDRKSTRLNSSHSQISYAVFCLKKKKRKQEQSTNAECTE